MALLITPQLQRYVDFAKNSHGTRETARQAMDCLDLTSLRGDEQKADILELCDLARHNRLASVCIYPEHVQSAARALKGSKVSVATVINYPTGMLRTLEDTTATPSSTTEDIKRAVAAGANQIDIVLPYAKFNAGNSFIAHSMLQSARETAGQGVTLKVILETTSFQNEERLRHACQLAIHWGADCLKTSTGKHKDGGATMEAAAVLLQEAFRAERRVGCKITGGIRTNDDCARYMTLARAIMGRWDAIKPDTFRIGASSLLEDLIRALGSRSHLPDYAPSV